MTQTEDLRQRLAGELEAEVEAFSRPGRRWAATLN